MPSTSCVRKSSSSLPRAGVQARQAAESKRLPQRLMPCRLRLMATPCASAQRPRLLVEVRVGVRVGVRVRVRGRVRVGVGVRVRVGLRVRLRWDLGEG